MATVEAYTKLICLTLKRDTFTEILGPLEQLMTREKSPLVGIKRHLFLFLCFVLEPSNVTITMHDHKDD